MSFSRYNTEDSVISSETVVRGLFSGDSNVLNGSSVNTSSYTEYYLNVYNGDPASSGSAVQFSIQYGNLKGSGSALINASVPGYTPSRVIYGEYRNLVYGTETTNFSFDGTTDSNDIFVINVARGRYKESLLPGSFGLTLGSGSNGSKISLIDDSSTTNLTRFIGENRYFNIISGSNGSYFTSGSATTYYGLFFPDLDIIVLNANALTSSFNGTGSYVNYNTGSTVAYNNTNLLTSIINGAVTSSFTLKSSETVSARYFFTRIKNGEYNYTTNPSIIDENGNLLYTTLVNNPQTYITTVGMYNDNNELLAVAKLSKPLIKDFTKEALIRVKLDY